MGSLSSLSSKLPHVKQEERKLDNEHPDTTCGCISIKGENGPVQLLHSFYNKNPKNKQTKNKVP